MIVEAYDPLDPTGNVTIKWDVMSWTPDGYVVSVIIYEYFISVSLLMSKVCNCKMKIHEC